jgi:hypothetical protein
VTDPQSLELHTLIYDIDNQAEIGEGRSVLENLKKLDQFDSKKKDDSEDELFLKYSGQGYRIDNEIQLGGSEQK